jgi:hypothetical protein
MIAMEFRVIPRSEWGARYDNGSGPRRLPATEAWLHHSVTVAPDPVPPFDDDYVAIRTLESIGESRFGRGISYTRLLTPAGLVFEGHSIDRVGTHTGGRNTVAVGYCLVGNYDATKPTDAQVLALAWCLQEDRRRGWLDRPALDGGHRDLKATACPGKYAYALIGHVNRLAAGPPVGQLQRADTESAVRGSREDMIITCDNPNRCGILSGAVLVDITDDLGARGFAQSAINRNVVAEIRVTADTWDRMASGNPGTGSQS